MSENFETKKEQLKELAKKSLVFSESEDALNDFIIEVDKISDNEEGLEYIESLTASFVNEKESVIKKYKDILGE